MPAVPPHPSPHVRDLERCVRLACVLEATARKPGNVHPAASFVDLAYRDFLAAACAVAPVLARTPEIGVGPGILEAVVRTRAVAPGNVNLGIILLLAPLAAVPVDLALDAGIGAVLRNLTRDDADLVYEAIRRAKPGGMGQVASEDLSEPPRVTLLEAMRLAADRDTVAAQYASDFQLVLQTGLPLLVAEHDFSKNWETAVIRLHLHLLATTPDTLIARKCGRATAESAARQARAVLEAGWPETSAGERLLEEFDAWLRGDGHRRNPGTTADLVAACLFAGFREGRLQPPPLFAQDA